MAGRRSELWIRIFLIVTLIKLNNAAQSCHPMDQCSCKLGNGKIISLWDIDTRSNSKSRFAFQATMYLFNYNPCTPITLGDGCKDALICATISMPSKPSQAESMVLAYPKYPSTSFADGSYRFAYTGDQGIATTVILECDQTAETPNLLSVVSFPPSSYIFTLKSKCACPGGCSYSPHGSGSSNTKKKLSTGSILCITLFAIVFVYLVGGLALNKFHLKKEGSDVIPNKSFWSDLPLLAKDGVVFSYSKIRGTKTEYQQI